MGSFCRWQQWESGAHRLVLFTVLFVPFSNFLLFFSKFVILIEPHIVLHSRFTLLYQLNEFSTHLTPKFTTNSYKIRIGSV
jgi:hypothetical protein